MKIEQVKDAETPDQMRAELQRMRRHNVIANNAMTLADIQGMSAEDRYTALAYHALKALCSTQQGALDAAIARPPAWESKEIQDLRSAASDCFGDALEVFAIPAGKA